MEFSERAGGGVAGTVNGLGDSSGRAYRYELWYLGQLLAAAGSRRLLEPGDEVVIGVNRGVVREVKLTPSRRDLKLVVDLIGRQ